MVEERGDMLIQQMLRGQNGAAANELVGELCRGYPVVNLRPLIHSDQDAVVKSVAWILSELGDLAAALMPEIGVLLGHPARYVRFFALEAVLNAARETDGAIIAKAVQLIGDSDSVVRWKAMTLLAWARRGQLLASVPFLRGAVKDRVVWLSEPEAPENVLDEARQLLKHGDAASRLFGAAAAVRLHAQDGGLIDLALASFDQEVSGFVQSQLVTRELRWTEG
jgi:hypothetical protein